MSDIDKYKSNSIFNKVLFGGAAGFFGTTLIYPLDTIRTRLQGNRLIKFNRSTLYRGFAYNLSYVIPEKAIKFGVNEYMLSYKELPNVYDRILCGSIAGGCQSFLSSPAEQIKIKMQSNNVSFTTAFKSSKIFRGLYFTIARDIPFAGIFFPMYFFIKGYNTFKNDVINDLFSGLISASVSTVAITPIDVIKTRYQLDPTKSVDIIINDMQINKNPLILFKGVVPRALSIGILYSITIALFDVQIRYFN